MLELFKDGGLTLVQGIQRTVTIVLLQALWNYVHNVVSSNYVQQMGRSLARRNSRAVLGRVHFPTLSIIYSNYNQCLCAVQIKHGTTNVHGRGTLEGDEMYPR